MSTDTPSVDFTYPDGGQLQVFRHDPKLNHPLKKYNRKEDIAEECDLIMAGRELESIMRCNGWPLSQVSGSQSFTLTIKRKLRDKLTHEPQILLCSFTGPAAQDIPQEVVAKVYDPLYYVFKRPTSNFDPALKPYARNARVVSQYVREAKVYDYLQERKLRTITRGCVPDYYGSWITAMPAVRTTHPAEYPKQRAVCLILMEHLPGDTLCDLTWNPIAQVSDRGLYRDDTPHQRYAYPEKWLTFAMRQWLETEARIHQTKLSDLDLYAQNIMVVPSPVEAMNKLVKDWDAGRDPLAVVLTGKKKGDEDKLIGGLPRPRIVVIDFADARLPNEYTTIADLPTSPMTKYWEEWTGSSGEKLFPLWWRDDEKRQKWLRKEFGGENAKKYLPVDESIFKK